MNYSLPLNYHISNIFHIVRLRVCQLPRKLSVTVTESTAITIIQFLELRKSLLMESSFLKSFYSICLPSAWSYSNSSASSLSLFASLDNYLSPADPFSQNKFSTEPCSDWKARFSIFLAVVDSVPIT
jgi:hypothetical protein